MIGTLIANCVDKYNQAFSKDALRDAIRRHNNNESVEVRKRRSQLLVREHHTPWTPEHAQKYRDKADIHDLEVTRKQEDDGEILGCWEAWDVANRRE